MPRPVVLKFVGDSTSLDRTVGGLSSRLQAVGAGMSRMGASLTRNLTLPIVGFGVVAVNEFTELRQVQGQTAAAIESTGGAANVTADHIEDLAARIGELSAKDAEEVQSMQNVLLTFTKVSNELGKGNAIFDRASLAIADMSARLGTDLNSAALQVGKALNDPIKGVTSLGRAGVQFTDEQKEMIATLVEEGDILGAQKIILEELETQFAGSAKAAGDAASPFTRLKLVALDLAEGIGSFVTPILDKLAGAAEWLGDKFANLSPSGQKVVGIMLAVAAAIGPVLWILGKLTSGIGRLIGMGSKVVSAIKLIGGALRFLAANPITLLIAAVVGLVILIVKNWDKIKAVTIRIWNAIKGFLRGAWNGIKGFALAIWNGIKDAVIKAWNALKDAARRIWNGIKDTVKNAMQDIKATLTGANLDKAVGVFERFRKGVQSELSKTGDLTRAQGLALIRGMIAGINSLSGELKIAAAQAAQAAIDAIRDKVKSASPSKVTMAIGRDVARGLEVGMRGRLAAVASAGAELGSAAASMRPSIPAPAGGMGFPGAAGGVQLHFHIDARGSIYAHERDVQVLAEKLAPQVAGAIRRLNSRSPVSVTGEPVG